MIALLLSQPSFSTYIPTTSLGVLGLGFGYLYFYFRNRDDNKLKTIQSLKQNDRIKAVEMYLSELGVSVNMDQLSSIQKFKLLERVLALKSRKYLIFAIASVILSTIIAFVLVDYNHKTQPQKTTVKKDTTVNRTKITQSGRTNVVGQTVNINPPKK